MTHDIFRVISKLFSFFKPEKQIPSREYVYLVASTLEEIRGDNNKALEYCKEYINRSVEGLIKRQYDRLSMKTKKLNNRAEVCIDGWNIAFKFPYDCQMI